MTGASVLVEEVRPSELSEITSEDIIDCVADAVANVDCVGDPASDLTAEEPLSVVPFSVAIVFDA